MNRRMFYWLENAQKSVEAFIAKCIIQKLCGKLRIVVLLLGLAAFLMMFCVIDR